MLSKSNLNDSQRSSHTAFAEAKAKRDSLRDDLPKKSRKTDISPWIHLFNELFVFHASDFLLWFNIG